MHGEERKFIPMNISQKCTLPRISWYIRTRHLGKPVVDAGEDAEDCAAKEHVVDVSNDVVGVLLLEVGG